MIDTKHTPGRLSYCGENHEPPKVCTCGRLHSTRLSHDYDVVIVCGPKNHDPNDWEAAEMSPGREIQIANARHIVACVNACAGLNPEKIPGLIEIAREYVAEQNKPVKAYCQCGGKSGRLRNIASKLRTALAKLEAKK